MTVRARPPSSTILIERLLRVNLKPSSNGPTSPQKIAGRRAVQECKEAVFHLDPGSSENAGEWKSVARAFARVSSVNSGHAGIRACS